MTKPTWKDELFAAVVYFPIALVFAACGWCCIAIRAVSRPLRAKGE